MERLRMIPDSERARTAGIEIWRNFMPEDMLERQLRHCLNMPSRKLVSRINLEEEFSSPVDELQMLVESFFGAKGKINTSITKRYPIDGLSEAYKWHQDPEEYHQEKLWLISLSGLAYLTAVDEDSAPIECLPNTLIIFPGNVWHKISNPIPKYGIRGFQFFGYSTAPR